jgi:dTDP-4-dehydrorhamnose reductase
VDDAEKERDLCRAIKAAGAGNVARVCARRGLRLIHISTDYVFDGRKGSPYVESDPVAPLNWYGQTKLDGEREVQSAGGNATIVRTQSLYGLHGRNFIKAILGQIEKGNRELRVVNDQVSSPTYTRHLADALLRLCRVVSDGVVHIACTGGCSWFDFARAIVARVGAKDVAVLPRSTSELNFPARRPAFSVLDTTRFTQLTGHRMPSWQQGLDEYLKEEPPAKL